MSTSSHLLRALCLVFALGSVACVEQGLRDWTEPAWEPPPPEIGPEPPVEHIDGAIWTGNTAAGSFLFFDQKARGAGDLVTVIIDENMQAQGSAVTDTERNTQVAANAASDIGLAELATLPFKKLAEFFGAETLDAAAGANINGLTATHLNTFEGEGSTERSGRFNAVLTCRVIRVLPGKVFHIQGRRSLVVNHEEQFLTLEGYVRQEDIGINNSVFSSAIADARMTLDGIGVLDDKQRPGLLLRVMDWLLPF